MRRMPRMPDLKKAYSSLTDYYKENPKPTVFYDSRGRRVVLDGVGMRLKGTVVQITDEEATTQFSDGRMGTLAS